MTLTAPPLVLAVAGFVAGKVDEARGKETLGLSPVAWAGIGFLAGIVIQSFQTPATSNVVVNPSP